jgi:Tol biopolymer transport system component
MNLDERARRAAEWVRRAVEVDELAPSAPVPVERFERYRRRKQRIQRATAGVVALGLALLVAVFVVRALGSIHSTPAAPLPSGSILYGQWSQRQQEAHWFTVDPDGSSMRDLHVVATCAEWFPDGSRILITNDADTAPGAPLRPAVIDPDGSSFTTLNGTRDLGLHLGCGDVSSDGTRIVLEGWCRGGGCNGIYSVRASDGGGLVRITDGRDSYPQYSPDGTQVVFLRGKAGVQPDGAGALFVVAAEGGGVRRITPWGSAFLDQAWSPDGRWIVFQKPYGQLFLVQPDGTDLHRVAVDLPPHSGAKEPGWSPDGRWIVFSLENNGASDIYAVRLNGTGLTQVTVSDGIENTAPDWSP